MDVSEAVLLGQGLVISRRSTRSLLCRGTSDCVNNNERLDRSGALITTTTMLCNKGNSINIACEEVGRVILMFTSLDPSTDSYLRHACLARSVHRFIPSS